ncbi:MAG: alpha-amylase family glycosyl hydrolase [Thermoleophilaceae bacterium]
MALADGVVYQIYPRSFQDSDGDGVGDLAGIRSRLDHLTWLGVDALWLSPIYPSPLADFGYDVSDYKGIDPVFGDLAEFDRLVEEAHARGLKLLMDVVPCHTSIEHSWFREHPDWYIWADRPNNWVAAFGGSAWSPYPAQPAEPAASGLPVDGRLYLHSFYPEQPDLDWRNLEVIAAMQDALRFWLERGADGYRVDAIDRLLKDPALRDDPPASEPYGLPVSEDEAKLALSNSRNAPDTGAALARIREACRDAFLVGEVYLPSARWQPYTDHFDAAFAFELLLAPWEAPVLRAAIEACAATGRAAWAMSNHDFGRLATRFGPENARAAALLLLTLPGPAFLYQGDEIGQGDGPPSERSHDRHGRDRFRHPMQWDGSPSGGFTTGEPWLPVVDPSERSVAAQRDDPDSTLSLVRELIALRRELDGDLELLDAPEGVVAYRRGGHAVAVNTTAEPLPVPLRGEPRLASTHGGLQGDTLAAHAGAIAWA